MPNVLARCLRCVIVLIPLFITLMSFEPLYLWYRCGEIWQVYSKNTSLMVKRIHDRQFWNNIPLSNNVQCALSQLWLKTLWFHCYASHMSLSHRWHQLWYVSTKCCWYFCYRKQKWGKIHSIFSFKWHLKKTPRFHGCNCKV